MWVTNNGILNVKNIGSDDIYTKDYYGYTYTNKPESTFGMSNPYFIIYNSGNTEHKNVIGYFTYGVFITLYTDRGFICTSVGDMERDKEFEYNLIPFSEVSTSDSCRLTSNRLSPPKFKLRKLFRFNPLTSARALEVNGG